MEMLRLTIFQQINKIVYMKKLLILLALGSSLSGCVTRVIVCSDWQEIRTYDGRVYSERVCKEQ
jgi:hypothetical protein